MIKLDRVNKYFYKGKSNQIHVINDTSMELPDKGIVCLLGPSGCGKTTLLNAVGGLDKVNTGTIIVDGEQITRKSARTVDDIRNAKIGYIFQNFNLFDDKTVFENVAVALRMVGVRDKKAIEERVNYCLESVGLYQFRKKNAGSLSGGQRQRVAIARAIVKNPRIIIADEPTGNLDSANTLEIMNIIKSISRDKLVVLVTHERNIAEFYSDYIAEMSDGKIVKSYTNEESKSLDCKLDNRIYLLDMPVQKEYSDEGVNVKIFSEDDRELNVKLVVKGSNIYIDTGGKLNIIDESGNIDLIEDHYKALDEAYLDDVEFDYSARMPENFHPKYSKLFGLKNMIKNGWVNILGFKKFKKFLLLGFVFAAMFAFLSVSNVVGILDVPPEDYLTTSTHYIKVSNPQKNQDMFGDVEDLPGVKYLVPGDTKISITIPLDDYYQTAQATDILNVSVACTSVLKESDIILGEKASKKNEVVIDKTVVNKFLKNEWGKYIGITRKKQLIGRVIDVPEMGEFTIVGISDVSAPMMYVLDSQVINVLANSKEQVDEDGYNYDIDDTIETKLLDIGLRPDGFAIESGRMPENVYEVVLDSSRKGETSIGKMIEPKIGKVKLKVVGFYKVSKPNDAYYVTPDTIKAYYTSRNKYFSVYAKNPSATLEKLEYAGLSAKITAETDKADYIKKVSKTQKTAFIVAGIILFIALVEMYLMLRSSFLARIKEVGILRAIGVKKSDIYRMFTGEVLAITFITAIPGIIFMYYIMSNVVKITDYLAGMYMVTPVIALISFALVVVFNLIAGLIPVARTLRKTPAEILSRIDI